MSALTAAAQVLRDSVAALTEVERVEPWEVVLSGSDTWWLEACRSSIANAGSGSTAKNSADHIALVATPYVVLALADLLDAMQQLYMASEAEEVKAEDWMYKKALALADGLTRSTP